VYSSVSYFIFIYSVCVQNSGDATGALLEAAAAVLSDTPKSPKCTKSAGSESSSCSDVPTPELLAQLEGVED